MPLESMQDSNPSPYLDRDQRLTSKPFGSATLHTKDKLTYFHIVTTIHIGINKTFPNFMTTRDESSFEKVKN
jgi:hypothetical protein